VVGAERLYREALDTAIAAGDARGAAVTRINLALFLARQGNEPEVLALAWGALEPLQTMGFEQDATRARDLLTHVHTKLDAPAFARAWRAATDDPPPAWL
jgi:hypothetical protein